MDKDNRPVAKCPRCQCAFYFDAPMFVKRLRTIEEVLAGYRMAPRQRECGTLAVRGATNREIAAQMGIRVMGVKNYLFNLYQVLGVRNRAQLIVRIEEERHQAVLTPRNPENPAIGT